MTSLTMNPLQEKTAYLRNVIRLDAVFCMVGGIFAILDAGFIAQFLGAVDSLIIMEVGAFLLIHSAILFFFSRSPNVPRPFVIYALAADGLWMVCSVVLMISSAFGITEAGKWAIFFLNEVVLAFFIFKFIGMRRMN